MFYNCIGKTRSQNHYIFLASDVQKKDDKFKKDLKKFIYNNKELTAIVDHWKDEIKKLLIIFIDNKFDYDIALDLDKLDKYLISKKESKN